MFSNGYRKSASAAYDIHQQYRLMTGLRTSVLGEYRHLLIKATGGLWGSPMSRSFRADLMAMMMMIPRVAKKS